VIFFKRSLVFIILSFTTFHLSTPNPQEIVWQELIEQYAISVFVFGFFDDFYMIVQ